MADVEDMYRVTYVQGESITVHMDERDVVFSKREKMYIANFSDWLVHDQDRVEELYTGLSLLTVKDTENLYTFKEVRRALEACRRVPEGTGVSGSYLKYSHGLLEPRPYLLV
jgi:hypothetical protein